MRWIEFQTGVGPVTVNAQHIFSAAEDPSTTAHDVELWWNAPRETLVREGLDAVGDKLGPDFVRFDTAQPQSRPVLVNRRLVVSVIPHPQHAGVCFLQATHRQHAVKGDLDAVTARLKGG